MNDFVEEVFEENEEDVATQDTFEDVMPEDLIDDEGAVENVCN